MALFFGSRQRRQKEGGEDGDDCDHHQKLNQRETGRLIGRFSLGA